MLKMKIYAELTGDSKKYRIKSLYDNKIEISNGSRRSAL
nr:MAG TPA: hypothetical protein [Caudoviricetes sp.]